MRFALELQGAPPWVSDDEGTHKRLLPDERLAARKRSANAPYERSDLIPWLDADSPLVVRARALLHESGRVTRVQRATVAADTERDRCSRGGKLVAIDGDARGTCALRERAHRDHGGR